jgi:hypothetical protein
MKALVISSLLFFCLRATSAEVGEDQKGECPYASQTSKREAKVIVPEIESAPRDAGSQTISK